MKFLADGSLRGRACVCVAGSSVLFLFEHTIIDSCLDEIHWCNSASRTADDQLRTIFFVFTSHSVLTAVTEKLLEDNRTGSTLAHETKKQKGNGLTFNIHCMIFVLMMSSTHRRFELLSR